jgi:hypothetical protein
LKHIFFTLSRNSSAARRSSRTELVTFAERAGHPSHQFAVEDIDAVVARLRAHGAELIGEVVQYEDTYRLAYIPGLKASSSD